MDWQEVTALSIVLAAAVLLLRRQFRPKKFSFERDTHCGCSAPSGKGQSIKIEGRRGEPPKVTVKM